MIKFEVEVSMALSIEFSHFFYIRTSLGDTALHEACFRKDVDRAESIVQEVISKAEPQEGYDFIAAKNSSGRTALDLVAQDKEGNGQAIFALLEKTLTQFSLTLSTDGRREDSPRLSALSEVVQNPLFSPRRSRHSATPSLPMDGVPPIFQALITKNVRALVHRIREKDDVNQIYEGQTPLTIAVFQKNLFAVQILLKAPDILPNKANSDDKTPLDVARRLSHRALIQLLLPFDPRTKAVLVD